MERDKDVIKRAETIQKFFNKINLSRSYDISYPVSIQNAQDNIYQAFGAWRSSLDSYTVTDQQRIQRYREYEQMCYVPELQGGLEIYADDASLYNDEDEVVGIQAENNDIEEALHDLWFKSLDMNYALWHIIFNTCKYGDAFFEIIPDNYRSPKRIKYLRWLPPQFVFRVEQDENLIEFIVRMPREDDGGQVTDTHTAGAGFKVGGGDVEEVHLKPWQVVHFKLDDKEFDPYGKSVLESGRLAFKQQKLIEDAMLIYRITRAPERRIFGIPVGTLPYREAMQRVQDFQQRYRKTPWIEPGTGEINYRNNPLSINDDFFLAKRPDGSGVTIDTLPGGQQLGEIDDARYFKEKILRTMRIPIAYLTGEMTGDVAKTSLSSMDVRFAKTIERIQKQIIKGLEKLAIIELAFKRFSIEDMQNFQVTLTAPSKIYEMQEIEVFNSRLNAIQSATQIADPNNKLFLPREYLYRRIMKFNDEEISDIKLMQQSEMLEQQQDKNAMAAAEQAATMGAPEGAAGGVEGGLGGLEAGAAELGGAEEAPAPEEELGTEVATGGEAGLELASRIMKIGSEKFLVENEEDIKRLIKFVTEYKETEKITQDKPKAKRRLLMNGFEVLFKKGELNGVIKRSRKKSKVLSD